jgi:hypothetical protein
LFGCDTHQTVPLNIVRRPMTTPIHELELHALQGLLTSSRLFVHGRHNDGAIDRVLRPAAANRTIRARFKSRCNVTGERQHASSTLRSFLERWTSLASGIIPILNHDSPLKKSGY